MPYYDTIEQDIARAKEILDRGKVRAEDMPVAMRDVAHVAGGTIYGVDTYAAYKLLESFVEEIERLRQQVKDIDNLHNELFMNPLIDWAQEQANGDGIDDGGIDWRPLVKRIIREHTSMRDGLTQAARVLDDAAEIAGRNDVPQLSQDYEQAAAACRSLAGGAAPGPMPGGGDDTEPAIRAFLWRWHGHDGLYGDDGEMQCQQCAPTWDYRNAPLADVVAAAVGARFTERLATTVGADADVVCRCGTTMVCPDLGCDRHKQPATPAQRELRKDARGQLDDVVVTDVRMFRLERMDKDRWWMRLYMPDGEDVVFDITTSGREIAITAEIEKS